MFDEKASKHTGTKILSITYDVTDDKWKELCEKAKLVFSGENYFEVVA
jgi:hypothetical protein